MSEHVCNDSCTVNNCKIKKRAYDVVYREKNRLKRRADVKAWKKANPEKVIAARARSAEKNRARARAWNEAHPEESKNRTKAWLKEHPDAKRTYGNTTRAKRKKAPGKHTEAEVQELLQKQGHLCYYCKDDISGSYQVDHVIPLIRGGSNWISNIVCACRPCNRRKWKRTADEFIADGLK